MESPAPLFKAIYLKLYLEVTKDAFKKLRMGPFFFGARDRISLVIFFFLVDLGI